jgi:hypothetical protein
MLCDVTCTLTCDASDGSQGGFLCCLAFPGFDFLCLARGAIIHPVYVSSGDTVVSLLLFAVWACCRCNSAVCSVVIETHRSTELEVPSSGCSRSVRPHTRTLLVADDLFPMPSCREGSCPQSAMQRAQEQQQAGTITHPSCAKSPFPHSYST